MVVYTKPHHTYIFFHTTVQCRLKKMQGCGFAVWDWFCIVRFCTQQSN